MRLFTFLVMNINTFLAQEKPVTSNFISNSPILHAFYNVLDELSDKTDADCKTTFAFYINCEYMNDQLTANTFIITI